jgi:hypothetical protein
VRWGSVCGAHHEQGPEQSLHIRRRDSGLYQLGGTVIVVQTLDELSQGLLAVGHVKTQPWRFLDGECLLESH